jgi:hypothetical protein
MEKIIQLAVIRGAVVMERICFAMQSAARLLNVQQGKCLFGSLQLRTIAVEFPSACH